MIFPIIQPTLYPSGGELPLYRDVEWDFAENRAVWRDGNPSMVTGLPAVVSWACNALQTMRCRYPIYSRDYGSELDSLIELGFISNPSNARDIVAKGQEYANAIVAATCHFLKLPEPVQPPDEDNPELEWLKTENANLRRQLAEERKRRTDNIATMQRTLDTLK